MRLRELSRLRLLLLQLTRPVVHNCPDSMIIRFSSPRKTAASPMQLRSTVCYKLPMPKLPECICGAFEACLEAHNTTWLLYRSSRSSNERLAPRVPNLREKVQRPANHHARPCQKQWCQPGYHAPPKHGGYVPNLPCVHLSVVDRRNAMTNMRIAEGPPNQVLRTSESAVPPITRPPTGTANRCNKPDAAHC